MRDNSRSSTSHALVTPIQRFLFRFVIFFIPLIYLFIEVLNFELKGIWIAYLISNILAFFVALFMYGRAKRKIKKICKLEEI